MAYNHTISVFAPDAPANGLYFVIRRPSDGKVFVWPGVPFNPVFETEDPTHWANYKVPLIPHGGGLWGMSISGTMLPVGKTYAFCLYDQQGETAAPSDPSNSCKFIDNWGVPPESKPLGGTPTDHNTGGEDALRVTVGGAGIDGVVVRAYLTSEYDADKKTATARGQSVTTADGRWERPIYRDPTLGYTFTFDAPGYEIEAKQVAAAGGA